MPLTQKVLRHKTKTFIKNGVLDKAQIILAPLNYGPNELEIGKALLLEWLLARRRKKTYLANQKDATRAERLARKEANKLATSFKRTIRLLFKNNQAVLTILGLYPSPYSKATNGHTNQVGSTTAEGQTDPQPEPVAANGGSQSTRRPSESTAAKIDRWHDMFENALELDEAHLARLAEANWPVQRIEEALAQVEAYAEADIAQQEKIEAYNEACRESRLAETRLREWYGLARGLALAAIKELPRDERAKMKKLLGL